VVTKNLLLKENYECVIVENGLEAISEFKKNKFDLILMDINMPVVDGVKATKLIRGFDAIVPIIALTASNVEDVKADYEGVGFTGMISKPFDNQEFFQAIEDCIALSKKTESLLIKVS
jgi:two-component system, sensor histidine kinase